MNDHPGVSQAVLEKSTLSPGKKMAGVGMHIASLAGPYGIGEIGDCARDFVDRLAELKMGVWQFLPTGPTAYGNSPYQPLSAFAGNEMLLGMDSLIRLGLLTSGEVQGLTGLSADNVDYGKLIPAKGPLLAQAASRFFATASGELRSDYENFLHLYDTRWLHDYAAYRVLKTMHGEQAWPRWETCFVQREQSSMQKLYGSQREAIEQVKIIQFLFDRQWQALKHHAAEKRVQLFGDMPIYIALDSADAWAHPEMLLIDRNGRPSHVAGVPPDYFSADGQLWGNPLYDWDFHRSNGYQWWIERMQHAANQSDLVRIDHFRGFESFWAVQYGAETACDGEWRAGPRDSLFDSLQATLGSLPIVAEDLGVITAEVEGLRDRHNFPGMKVLQFLVGDPAFKLDDITENTVCYTGTHDNDTTVGWFNGGDADTRSPQEIFGNQKRALSLTGGTHETIHLDMIRLALNSKARLAIAPMQDFLGLGSEARLNIPGTTMNNWRWRLSEKHLSQEICDSVTGMVEESTRS